MKEEIVHTFVVLAYKESKYLEKCIKSVLNQTVKTNVVVATATPNEYISKLAKKYKLEIIVNENHRNIGGDYDFALHCVESDLITISHQDDIYDSNYAEEVIKQYKKNPKASIIIPDYYEIKNDKKIYTNRNFRIKRILLFPLRFRGINKFKFVKRFSLRFGDPICCPAVTYVQKRMPESIFECEDLVCSVDWFAYEQLSKLPYAFQYFKKNLMGHRIHEESTTTKTIGENRRTIEDMYMFRKFWPMWFCKIINHFYKNAEKGNDV